MISTTRTIRCLAAVLCAAVTLPAFGITLYDNGPLITHPGGMTGAAAGADRSAITPPGTTFGFGAQQTAPNRVADDFPNNPLWAIEKLCFFVYQTATANITAPTITGITLRIWDGTPGASGSNIVFGDTSTNRLSNVALTNIYRTSSTDTANVQRRIQQVEVDFSPPLTLPLAQNYWLDWSLSGTLTSGPWQPPVSLPAPNPYPTGNAVQSTTGGPYNPLVDTGANVQVALPFVIKGVIIPEPSSLAFILVGLGLLAYRRR